MSEQDDSFTIGPVGPIPIVAPDEKRSAARQRDAAVADAMLTPQELQAGMRHPGAGVRWFVVERLVARGFDDPGTIPALTEALTHDPDSDVRFMVATVLYKFGRDPRIVDSLLASLRNDPDLEVRAEAMTSLDQLGITP